jgi:hypothetical protein
MLYASSKLALRNALEGVHLGKVKTPIDGTCYGPCNQHPPGVTTQKH